MLNEDDSKNSNILKEEEKDKKLSIKLNSPMVIVSSPNIKLNYIPIESNQ